MRIAIATDEANKNIVTVKEYEPVGSKGEVAHFIAELELIKLDLLDIWEEICEAEE
ncbi:MAG: hypothetical protein KAJ49_04540 [Arcobacteraceae bacterium]|nr:hypothetical protein [Arcobacteraceae bacterium]